MIRIDALQYCNWSAQIFQQLRAGKVDAIHVTIAYHEDFRETVLNLEKWNRLFEAHGDLIMRGESAQDVRIANETGRTAVFFGFQNPSPIESDIGLVEIWHKLGIRFMQLTYNNQSLLAAGCYEPNDSGITRMGKEVIKEMNRVGLVIDMSHSGDRSTIEAAHLSQRPIAITHANLHAWHGALRNKRDDVVRAVTENGGMLGFSMYPHHLHNKSDCTLDDFCRMIADAVSRFGIAHFGFGSDLCQGHDDSEVQWMRVGRWTKQIDYGEGSKAAPGFPAMPEWFQDNRNWDNIANGLQQQGFHQHEVEALMGGNWLRFFEDSFTPRQHE